MIRFKQAILAIFLSSLAVSIGSNVQSQINPINSPYYTNGSYAVISETLSDASPSLLTYRPNTSSEGDFPVLLFQPGANGFFQDNINVNTYDLYMEHLASYGYVVVVIDNMDGGPNNSLFSNVYNRLVSFSNNTSHWMSSAADISKLVIGGHSNGGMNASKLLIQEAENVLGIVYMASYPNPGTFGLGGDNVSDYSGNVLFMVGDEDDTSVPLTGSTNDVAYESYTDKFTSADCKTWVLFNGVGHGGFGDYTHDSHTVGSIGREPVTASVRHYLVSFMERTTKQVAQADEHMQLIAYRPNSVGEFATTCSLIEANEPGTSGLSSNYFDFSLFPNPAEDIVEISIYDNSTITSVQVIDATGRAYDVELAGNKVAVDKLATGQYFISINHSGHFVKLIKH